MSDEIYIIRNQLGQFWTRAGEWVDGREPQRLLKLKHQDEALNQLVELSAKDIELRGEVLATSLNDKKEPVVETSEHLTPTLAEQAAARQAAQAELEAAQAASEADTTNDAEATDATLEDDGAEPEPLARSA
ncbi:MAG: hypothetical protein Cons2KO_24120 [Congregibacter sp.]